MPYLSIIPALPDVKTLTYYLAIALAILVPLFHILGAISALRAVMTARTPQGSAAWAISLITFPYVAVPLYWLFGRGHFHGFVEAMRNINVEHHKGLAEILDALRADPPSLPEDRANHFQLLGRLGLTPWTGGNSLQLLIDGQATFDAIFAAIRDAKQYVLVQFFIIHDDEIGRALKALLLRRAADGIRIYVLYDEIGSYSLPKHYINELQTGGVETRPFNTRQGFWNRFQINFRNHRKIVIVDGQIGFAGGHNVGDEYLGRSRRFGHWRDTHFSVLGPAVIALQLSFTTDWYWATREVPNMNWQLAADTQKDQTALILPTGPADTNENCLMMFLESIASAKKRIWIASPYFVPDVAVFEALKLAARRGLDVRIILPERPDHLFVYLAAFDFLPESFRAGIKIYRYTNGFLHQKVFLIDDDFASVGSANLDTRSIRLNFEVTMLAIDKEFGQLVEQMLLKDLADSRLSSMAELDQRGYLFHVMIRIARLLSPLL